MAPLFVLISLLLAASILITRRAGGEVSAAIPFWIGALVLAAGWSLWRQRRSFYRLPDALLRIETAQRLQNRLSCAYAGVLPWPQPELYRGDVARLRPQVIALPLLCSAFFIAAALLLPLQTAATAKPSAATVQPAAWSQVEDWAQLLREEQLIAPEAAEQLEQSLEELRKRPQEEWYSQGSLEAGEALREQTLLAMQELARQMQSGSTILSEAMARSQNPEGMAASLAAAGQLDQAWAEQMRRMQNGELSLSPEALAQMQAMDFSQIEGISPEQLAAMQERLRQGAEQLGAASGLSEMELQAVELQARQAFTGMAERGPGPAPMVMHPEGTDLKASRPEAASNQDMQNAFLGETVATGSRPGNEREEAAAPATEQGGAATELGRGGNVIWQETYTPQERAVLEQYFQ